MQFSLNKTQLAAITLLSSFVFAEISLAAQQASAIEVENPYAREVPPAAPASASFMTLKNKSDQDIFLVQAISRASKKVELHTHAHANGMMQMRQVNHIMISAKGQTKLQPGSYHIMLINPTHPLKAGESIQVKLVFKDGSHKNVRVPIQSMKEMIHSGHHQH